MSSQAKYQVLARRYRTQNFRDVVGQEAIVTTLKNAIRFDKVAHAYLFSGSRGVGKTTLARLFAKALNCQKKNSDLEPCNSCSSCLEISSGQSLDVIEIDGASNRGIDDVRQINETAHYSPSPGHYKVYIIDEVHMLTKEAFNALLKTLEEPPEKTKFFFATTEPHKVLPTIISRCQRFDLKRIPIKSIIEKLEEITKDLSRNVESEALYLIASFSDGSLRDAESLFDQILCFSEEMITKEVVQETLGLVAQEHLFQLDTAFSEGRTAFAFELVELLFLAGKDLAHFFSQLIEHVRTLTLARTLGLGSLHLPPELAARYVQSAHHYASSQCLYLLEYLLRKEVEFQKSVCQKISLEALLLHYIQSRHRIPVEVLVRRLTLLEESLKLSASSSLKVEENTSSDPNGHHPLSSSITQAEAPLPTTQSPDLTENHLKKSEPPSQEDAPSLLNANLPIERKLEPVPFNPFVESKITQSIPEKREQPLKEDLSTPTKYPQSRYDTLIRFAAVELEGTVKLN